MPSIMCPAYGPSISTRFGNRNSWVSLPDRADQQSTWFYPCCFIGGPWKPLAFFERNERAREFNSRPPPLKVKGTQKRLSICGSSVGNGTRNPSQQLLTPSQREMPSLPRCHGMCRRLPARSNSSGRDPFLVRCHVLSLDIEPDVSASWKTLFL